MYRLTSGMRMMWEYNSFSREDFKSNFMGPKNSRMDKTKKKRKNVFLPFICLVINIGLLRAGM